MPQQVRPHLSALEDTAILALYAACWALAWLGILPGRIGIEVAGFLLSTAAACVVLVIWTLRPAYRPGIRFRDVWPAVLIALAVVQTDRASIANAALFDLLRLLECIAIFLVAVHLCLRRPQSLFLVTWLLMAGIAVSAARWQGRAPMRLDSFHYAAVAAVSFLGFLPWFAGRRVGAARRGYHWVVFAAGVILLVLGASGVAGKSNIIAATRRAWPGETRDFISALLRHTGWMGCGPSHYPAVFAATVPEDFAGQSAGLPGGAILLVEHGAIGLAAVLLFGLSMLWRFRPGPWAAHHGEVLETARPLRWAAAFAFFLFLTTPSFRSLLGWIVLWSLFGMLRSFSSRGRPAAVALLTGRPDTAAIAAPTAGGEGWPKSTRQMIAFIAVIVAGTGLAILEARPWIATRVRRRPRDVARHDPAFLRRLESSIGWWPHDPRTYELVAVHYHERVNAGKGITPAEIDRVTNAYRRMIRANPYDPIAHLKLVTWHIRRWRVLKTGLEDAKKTVRRGLEYCPGSFELWYLKGRVHRELGEPEEAAEAFEQARWLRPGSAPVLQNLAELALAAGNRTRAEHYLRLARQIRPAPRAAATPSPTPPSRPSPLERNPRTLPPREDGETTGSIPPAMPRAPTADG